jgi:tRNA pseudouridine55 synthase
MTRERKRRRNISGIVLLDKDPGPTSNEALQTVKRLFQAQKAGHTGSLDPLASGLLPVCLGEATKVSGFLLDANKRYWVRCRLGQRTTTGDAEGKVVEIRPVEGLDQTRVERVLEGFEGSQEQIPPMYSALKHQGQRLYKLARQGVEVERKPRPVVIHTLKLLCFEGDTLEFGVRCSKGTYVRTLAEDIGAALGCGAHVIALRRLAVGPYDGVEMVDLATLRRLAAEGAGRLDTVLLPMESALAEWPDVRLSDDAAYYLRRGQPVLVPHAPTQGWVRLYARDRRFLGVGQILDDGRVAPRRLVSGA